IDQVPKQLYIGGEWVGGGEGTLAVEDPSNGESLTEIADASPDDAKRALDAAVEAADSWAAHAPRERGEILRRAFETIVALAAGCTIVVKPAQQTPLSMLMLAKILEEVGLPGGVLNLITASSASKTTGPLIADPRLRKLSFTGSTEVGRQLMGQASDNLLRLSMELGGNAPFLVFEDADVDAAVQGALIAKMRNIGEACTAANRFHVAAPVADEFASKLAEKMGQMKVGRGTEDDVEVGP